MTVEPFELMVYKIADRERPFVRCDINMTVQHIEFSRQTENRTSFEHEFGRMGWWRAEPYRMWMRTYKDN